MGGFRFFFRKKQWGNKENLLICGDLGWFSFQKGHDFSWRKPKKKMFGVGIPNTERMGKWEQIQLSATILEY